MFILYNMINEKDEISKLKDYIVWLYKLIKYVDEKKDLHLIELTRGVISIEISELLNIEPEDL